jgi:hypothetical protein
MAFSAIGIYSVNSSSFEIYLTALFGVFGFICVKLGFPAAPLLLGYVLGPMMEENLPSLDADVGRRRHRVRDAATQPRLHHRNGADPDRDGGAGRAQAAAGSGGLRFRYRASRSN